MLVLGYMRPHLLASWCNWRRAVKNQTRLVLEVVYGFVDPLLALLDLVATQCESTNAAWSVRDRPDVMATLFQIGFHHSWPRANPVSNELADAVRCELDNPLMHETFGVESHQSGPAK